MSSTYTAARHASTCKSMRFLHLQILSCAAAASATPFAKEEQRARCNAFGCDSYCSKCGLSSFQSQICQPVLDKSSGFPYGPSGRPQPPFDQNVTERDCGCYLCDEKPPFRVNKVAPGALIGTRSWSFCTGECCQPLKRNRTCVVGNVLFLPSPSPDKPSFYLLSDDRNDAAAVGCYLHNRFTDAGRYTGSKKSYFAPAVASEKELAQLGRVTRVVEDNLFLAADLHSNIGHNMLDAVFPIYAAGIRIRGAAEASLAGLRPKGARRTLAARALAAVPDLSESSSMATRGHMLLYDEPHYLSQGAGRPNNGAAFKRESQRKWAHWHRGTEERQWTEAVFGGMSDLPQLVAACPDGCLLRSLVYGVGHVGLSTVDEHNSMTGTREYRALWHYRQRVHKAFSTRPLPLIAWREARRHQVTFVSSRRQSEKTIRGFTAMTEAVKALHGYETTVSIVKWEAMSFAKRAQVLADTTVLVTGVGTASMSAFMLPAGAVIACFGWRESRAKSRIMYYDSHILNGLEHVRVLYYPYYEASEILVHGTQRFLPPGTAEVSLNVTRAAAFIKSAMDLQVATFQVPVAQDLNSNYYDKAYAELVRRSQGAVHRIRNNELDFENKETAPPGCLSNAVDELLWGSRVKECSWGKWVPQLLKDYDLSATAADRQSPPVRQHVAGAPTVRGTPQPLTLRSQHHWQSRPPGAHPHPSNPSHHRPGPRASTAG